MAKRYVTAFAEGGDKTTVPDTSASTDVNYDTGYTGAYELAPEEAGYKYIERQKFNQIMNDATGNIKQWQEQSLPDWHVDIAYPQWSMFKYSNNETYVCHTEQAAGTLGTDFSAFINLKHFGAYAYAVSQLANGVSAAVGFIYAGNPIAAFDYLIHEDGRIYFKNGATGTFSDPLVFDPTDGTDTGVTGTLKNVKSILRSDVFGLDQDWETAELTNTGALFNDGTVKYRVTGGTYTNPYNKPLFISIYALASASSATIRVDGVDRFTLPSNATGTLVITIPPLATYRLLGTDVVYNWNEDRPNGN